MSDDTALTPIQRRILDRAEQQGSEPPEEIAFLHSTLTQVGMPRRATEARFFERTSGNATMRLEAGTLFQRGKFVEQPLPYGTKPRLVMIYISSIAIKTRRREVEIGQSTREFLIRLGIDTSGGAHGGYTGFKKQMEALAACRLVLGFSEDDRDVTINTQPIRRFEAWLHREGEQGGIWPGLIELSPDFYDTLIEHAVPLDQSALAVLKHSALALDIYTWLAHRLCRVRRPAGVMVSWQNLKEQFGQEYADPKNFKREFKQALHQVRAAYRDARLEEIDGGLLLKESPPPVPRTTLLTP